MAVFSDDQRSFQVRRNLVDGHRCPFFEKQFGQQHLIGRIDAGDGRRFKIFEFPDLRQIPGEGEKRTHRGARKQPDHTGNYYRCPDSKRSVFAHDHLHACT